MTDIKVGITFVELFVEPLYAFDISPVEKVFHSKTFEVIITCELDIASGYSYLSLTLMAIHTMGTRGFSRKI